MPTVYCVYGEDKPELSQLLFTNANLRNIDCIFRNIDLKTLRTVEFALSQGCDVIIYDPQFSDRKVRNNANEAINSMFKDTQIKWVWNKNLSSEGNDDVCEHCGELFCDGECDDDDDEDDYEDEEDWEDDDYDDLGFDDDYEDDDEDLEEEEE